MKKRLLLLMSIIKYHSKVEEKLFTLDSINSFTL